MSTFDYAGYWLDIVEPAWRALPEQTRCLIKAVTSNETVRQDKSTGLDKNHISEHLYNRVAAMPSKELARAAKVAHDYSHANPGRDAERLASDCENIGAGWKFALVADHVLSERHKLGYRGSKYHPKGYFLQHMEGLIRPTYNSTDEWLWEEVGLTCEDNLQKIDQFVASTGQPDSDTLKSWCDDLLDALHPPGDPDRDLVKHDQYMVSKETQDFMSKFRIAEARGGELPSFAPRTAQGIMDAIRWIFPTGYGLRPTKLTRINHRLSEGCDPHTPVRRDSRVTTAQLQHHPFVIGSRHISNSSGSMLRPESAPCDFCGYEYKDHISDKAILLEHHPSMTTEQAAVASQHALKDMREWLNQLGVEHIGLPKSNQAPKPTINVAELEPLTTPINPES